MRNKIIELLAKGDAEEAINEVEDVLESLKDEYFKWVALKTRFNKLKSENIKGIVSQSEFTLEGNKINALIMEHFKSLDAIVQEYFTDAEKFSLSPEGFKERLQNQLIEQYKLLESIVHVSNLDLKHLKIKRFKKFKNLRHPKAPYPNLLRPRPILSPPLSHLSPSLLLFQRGRHP